MRNRKTGNERLQRLGNIIRDRYWQVVQGMIAPAGSWVWRSQAQGIAECLVQLFHDQDSNVTACNQKKDNQLGQTETRGQKETSAVRGSRVSL